MTRSLLGEAFRGSSGRRLRSQRAVPRLSLTFLHIRASRDPSPSGVLTAPLDAGMGGESSAGATPYPPSPGGEERSSGLFPQLRGPPRPFPPPDGRLPRQVPRPVLAYLGVHTKLTGPRRRSHIVVPLVVPSPSPRPCSEAARCRPHSSGGNCNSSVSSKLQEEGMGGAPDQLLCPAREPAARRGARDSERAGAPGRGGGSDRELQPTPGARVRHYLALRLSFDWSNGTAPRPPPPPGSPAPPIPVRGGRLKGTPRLFCAPAQPPGLPGLSGPARPVKPVPGAPPLNPASPAPAWGTSVGRTRSARGF